MKTILCMCKFECDCECTRIQIAAVSCAFKRWIVYFKFCNCPLRLYFVIRFVNCNFPSRFNYPLVLNLPGNFSIFDFVIQFKCTAVKSKFHLLFSHQFSLLCWAHFTKRLKRIFRHFALAIELKLSLLSSRRR